MYRCLRLSITVKALANIGNTSSSYKFLLCYGSLPECPLPSPAVLPRSRGATPETPEKG